jgi:hypothetical protein
MTQATQERKHHEDHSHGHTIHLTFSTTAGDLEDDFPTNQPLHAIKRRVMGKLHLDPSKADEYVVTFNGNVLDENKTFNDLNVPDNSVLILERKEVIKI